MRPAAPASADAGRRSPIRRSSPVFHAFLRSRARRATPIGIGEVAWTSWASSESFGGTRSTVTVVVVVAAFVAILSTYKLTPSGLEKRSPQVGAASSQILVDSPGSALVAGASVATFDALSTRAQIYGQYLSSLEASDEDRQADRDPARDDRHRRALQHGCRPEHLPGQPSEDRANQLVDQGAPNRLVFTAQEGVPIISVDAQAPTADRAAKLAIASFITLKRYVRKLKSSEEYLSRPLQSGPDAAAKAALEGVTVRELGTPEGGTIGGANDKILMVLAFITVFLLGCAAIIDPAAGPGAPAEPRGDRARGRAGRLGGSNGAAKRRREAAQSGDPGQRSATAPGNAAAVPAPGEADPRHPPGAPRPP